MKIFLDANILVAVFNKEYPAYDSCARVLSLAGKDGIEIVCSTLSLGIAYYFAEKKSGRKRAHEKISILCKHIHISPCGPDEVENALKHAHVDFEDALQEASAKSAGCEMILTLNAKDFWFSKLEQYHPEFFLTRGFVPRQA
jgi:predicted nucleic acid-binding protein